MIGAASQFDSVLLLTWAFFIFFGGLVYWLRREDKREGYPLVAAGPNGEPVEGFPEAPPPKVFQRIGREPTQMPHVYADSKMLGERLLRFDGAPLVPLGNPLLAEIGPGAYPLREDLPMLAHGTPQVVPLRVATDWRVAAGDTDPRGMAVFDSRRAPVGTVAELWVDRSVKILRYLEVSLSVPEAAGQRVLLPIYYADISRRRGWVRVSALLASQFASAPTLADPDQITAREEDRVNAFYAGGLLFSRASGSLALPGAAWQGSR